MHAAVLTILLVAGASGDVPGSSGTSSAGYQDSGSGGGCSNCGGAGESGGCGERFSCGGLFGGGNGEYGSCCNENMPQDCYNYSYGCYPGNDRRVHRYPAFHGSYYRKPPNYRNLFDYPWHADLHEPTSLFSYNVAKENAEKDKAGTSPQSVKSPSSLGARNNNGSKTKSTQQATSLSAKYEGVQPGNIRR